MLQRSGKKIPIFMSKINKCWSQLFLGDVYHPTQWALTAGSDRCRETPALKGAKQQRSLGPALGFNIHVGTQQKSIEKGWKIVWGI